MGKGLQQAGEARLGRGPMLPVMRASRVPARRHGTREAAPVADSGGAAGEPPATEGW